MLDQRRLHGRTDRELEEGVVVLWHLRRRIPVREPERMLGGLTGGCSGER